MEKKKGFSKNIDMTQGSIARSLIMYAIPIVLSDFLQQFYNSADCIIVGRILGKEALAAVGETSFITNIFLGCFLGVSLGSTVVVSRAFGAGQRTALNEKVGSVLRLTGILCVAFTVLGLVFIPALLNLVGTAADVYENAKIYLTVYMGGISSQLIYNMLSSLLKAIGDSRRPLYILAFTAVVNIGLDYVMVGPMNMGIAGAAYATVIAQAISCVALLYVILRTPTFDRSIIKTSKLNFTIVKEIFVIAVPYSIQSTINSISNLIVISFINYFGSAAMAAWSVYQKVNRFVMSSILSVGSATTTFVSQNVGANKPDRIKKGINTGLIVAVIVSSFYALVLSILKRPVSALFTTDTEVIELSAMILKYLLPVQVLSSATQIFASALRGLGDSVNPTLIMLAGFVGVRQIYIHIRWHFKQSLMVIVGSQQLVFFLCAVMMTIFIIHKSKKDPFLSKGAK